MSSFVNDNVSESKKQQQEQEQQGQQQQQQQLSEKEENNLKTTTTSNTNTKETTTNTNNDDNNENKKHNETIKTTTTSKNKSEVELQQKSFKNYDNNKSNNDVDDDDDNENDDDENNVAGHYVVDDDDDDNVKDKNLNKTKDKSLSKDGAATATITCCDTTTINTIMTPGDVEQHVASFDNQITFKQSTSNEQPMVTSTTAATIAIDSSGNTNVIDATLRGNNIQIKFESLTTSSLQGNDGSLCNTAATATTSSSSSPTITSPLTTTKTGELSSPLPPLPPGVTSNITGTLHLPHISSEPIFGVQLRNKNNNNGSSSPKQTIGSSCSGSDWRSHTSELNCSGVIKSGTVSASASPSMVRKTSDAAAVLLPRRVSFPKSDNQLVTGYLEPANPWEHVCMVKSISEIAELYMTSCQKHNTKPLQCILDHLKAVDLTKQLRRQPLLSLKSIKLAPSDCEALEEVLKRVQYKSIDLSDCKLDEAAASALFEMIEYYEATNELDISSNAIGMTHRGWISCTYMISHSQELQVLNAEGNPISKLSADHLGNALSISNLHTLKLEHCGLKGAPLSGLCFKLWHNRVLKELWLAHNDLDCSDADTIAEMLKVNHYLELIDISNNIIRDEGLRHIVMALIMQSKELERRTTFQRTAAIDDDGDCMSPVESSPPVELGDSNESLPTDWSSKDESYETPPQQREQQQNTNYDCDLNNESILSKDAPLPTIEEKFKGSGESAALGGVGDSDQHKKLHHQLKVTSAKPPLISSVGSTIDETDGDEDTEDTVRSSTLKSSLQNPPGGGQSMLDKLLSMNSESSSEDGASNLSTDTLAACCFEEASLISDDIFAAPAATTNTTTTSTNTKAPTTQELEETSQNDRGLMVTSAILNSTMTMQTPTPATSGTSTVTTGLLQNSPRDIELLIDNKVATETATTIEEMTKSNLIETPPAASTITATNDALNMQSPLVNINNNNNNNNLPFMSAAQISSTSPVFSNNPSEDHHPHQHHHCHENLPPQAGIFEVTAEESDCQLSGSVSRVMVAGSDVNDPIRSDHHHHHAASRALDVNKNTKLGGEDFDDTHSTDSAFESASEGDISRHLPEEFTRLSTSLESTRLDDVAKEMAIETATIASESNECLIAAAAQITPSSTPTPATPPFAKLSSALQDKQSVTPATAESSSPITNTCLSTLLPSSVNMNNNSTNTTPPLPSSSPPSLSSPAVKIGFTVLEEPSESPIAASYASVLINDVRDKMPKVTIAQDSFTQKYKSNSATSTSPSPTPTPPPPSTSPGGASSGLRRTDSSCAFLTQSSRNRSQSTDSLCSDNSLDGSIASGDLNFSSSSQLNEKIAKNDTLTRQQRPPLDATPDTGTRTPGGLKALAVWNNNLTKEAGLYISDLLAETVSIELLNIGKNCLSNEFVTTIRESLIRNTTLTTLGLQSAHLSAKGIETLSSILTFGGNSTLQRIDIRDNKLEVESLTKIAEVLKSNTTVTQIDIDDEPKRLSVGSEAHLDYSRVLENVRSMCSRNEKTQAQILQEKTTASAMAKRRGGYYMGSRKISLTCHSRPVVDATKNVVVSVAPNSKLDVKRKAGTRLRSPVPSPTTISPSSSPNRANRFQVFRVAEVSPLTSPSTQKQIVDGGGIGANKAVSSNSVAIPLTSLSADGSGGTMYPSITSTSLPTSCSLPSMATISSSTQSIKRLSVSPRSRFLVRKVYEDPNLPLASRTIPPITPPLNAPPTPISKNSRDSLSSATNLEATPPASLTTQQQHHQRQQYIKRENEEELKHLFSSSSSTQPVVGTPPSPPTTVVTPPTIKQQHNNTTTDTTSTAITTPILKLKDNSSTNSSSSASSAICSTPITASTLRQREHSTNNAPTMTATTTTIINDNQITHLTTATTTISTSTCNNLLQSSPSNLSTLSTLSSSPSESSSSSSSTSPASNNDTTDSSSSTSSSPASSVSSSSSTSSSVHSNEALSHQQQHLTGGTASSCGQCPIAVFGDNDITLTKNTVNEVFAAQAAAAAAAKTAAMAAGNIDEESSTSDIGESRLILSSDENVAPQVAQQQQRARKVSWIANPTAVDKLLTLFHNPTTIFQRSSSPESKTTMLSSTTGSQLSQSPPSCFTEAPSVIHQQQQQQMSQKSLVPMRKQSPPSWTKLGNDIIQAAGSNNADLANAVATTAAAVVTEQSRSFLDAASKQFRDFSKQVFRQNLSFGNEPAVTTVNTTSTTMMTTASGLIVPQTTAGESGALQQLGMEECTGVGCCGGGSMVGTNGGCSCGLLSSMMMQTTNLVECDADCIPTDVKQEIKENISPEHTINEETLHTIQKYYGSAPAKTTSDLKNNDDLMDFKGDYSAATSSVITPHHHQQQQQQHTPPQTQPPPPTSAAAASSGVENNTLPAHNT